MVIADRSEEFRATLRQILGDGGIEVVAEADNGPDTVTTTLRCRPDTLLADVELPGGGLMAVARVSARVRQTQVVVLTDSERDEDVFTALRAGAAGYLLKSMALERLPAAIEGVMAGQFAMPRVLMAKVIDEYARRGPRRAPSIEVPLVQRLSARELEALELLLDGLGTQQIAARMFVKPSSVRAYLTRALRKLRLPDREAAQRLRTGR